MIGNENLSHEASLCEREVTSWPIHMMCQAIIASRGLRAGGEQAALLINAKQTRLAYEKYHISTSIVKSTLASEILRNMANQRLLEMAGQCIICPAFSCVS